MNVLISNDDGIFSEGLIALANSLCSDNNVLVLAPDGNRSASSHSLTINKALKLKKHEEFLFNAYSLSGTPADCVKFAKLHFKEFKPDVVIAGINKGHNLGSDILYSGTVSIACEASFFGHVAFAFSTYNLTETEFTIHAKIAKKIIENLLPYSENGDIWNVNFPLFSQAEELKGVKITSLGKQLYTDRYEKLSDDEYKLVGEIKNHSENCEDCDIEWIKKGYITISPILFNKTDYNKIKLIGDLCIKL